MDPATEIRTRRERLGLDQEQFAGLVGASVEAVSNWERGVNKPRHLARVLAALDRAEAAAYGGSDVRSLADDELWRRHREHLAEIERRYYNRTPDSRPLPGGTGEVPPDLRRRPAIGESVVDNSQESSAPNG